MMFSLSSANESINNKGLAHELTSAARRATVVAFPLPRSAGAALYVGDAVQEQGADAVGGVKRPPGTPLGLEAVPGAGHHRAGGVVLHQRAHALVAGVALQGRAGRLSRGAVRALLVRQDEAVQIGEAKSLLGVAGEEVAVLGLLAEVVALRRAAGGREPHADGVEALPIYVATDLFLIFGS